MVDPFRVFLSTTITHHLSLHTALRRGLGERDGQIALGEFLGFRNLRVLSYVVSCVH